MGTNAGTLNTQFSRNQFNLMNQKFLTTADVPEDVTLSVREAARLHSNMGGQGLFKCLCQTTCLTKNANASGTLLSAILAVMKIEVARIMRTPRSNKVIQRNPFPLYRVSSFFGSQKLISACWGSPNHSTPPTS